MNKYYDSAMKAVNVSFVYMPCFFYLISIYKCIRYYVCIDISTLLIHLQNRL